jgi:S-adenosylmethionine:tRNA ribosyltransferase-isomerase
LYSPDNRDALNSAYPYEAPQNVSLKESLSALKKQWEGEPFIHTSTQLFIMPSYKFRVVDKLVTNFHQPRSTLLLLIAAFVGDDWRTIYSHALKSNYRFLSYGDAQLLTRKQ